MREVRVSQQELIYITELLKEAISETENAFEKFIKDENGVSTHLSKSQAFIKSAIFYLEKLTNKNMEV